MQTSWDGTKLQHSLNAFLIKLHNHPLRKKQITGNTKIFGHMVQMELPTMFSPPEE